MWLGRIGYGCHLVYEIRERPTLINLGYFHDGV